MKKFFGKNFFGKKIFLGKNFFGEKILLRKIFFEGKKFAQILTAVGSNLIHPHQSGLNGVLGAPVLAKAKGLERETALWVA